MIIKPRLRNFWLYESKLSLKLLKLIKNMVDVKKEIKRFLRVARKSEEFKRVEFILFHTYLSFIVSI